MPISVISLLLGALLLFKRYMGKLPKYKLLGVFVYDRSFIQRSLRDNSFLFRKIPSSVKSFFYPRNTMNQNFNFRYITLERDSRYQQELMADHTFYNSFNKNLRFVKL